MIKFIEGEHSALFNMLAAPFRVGGDDAKTYETPGICINLCGGKHSWYRYSRIFVVKQKNPIKTLGVLVHELMHAAVWIFHLPRGVDHAIDGERS